MGGLFDLGEIDEVHAFMATKLIGGAAAPSPIGGEGVAEITQALAIDPPHIELIEGDLYIRGRVKTPRN